MMTKILILLLCSLAAAYMIRELMREQGSSAVSVGATETQSPITLDVGGAAMSTEALLLGSGNEVRSEIGPQHDSQLVQPSENSRPSVETQGTSRERGLANALKYFNSVPDAQSVEKARAANILLAGSIASILDAQGQYRTSTIGASTTVNLLPATHFLSLNGRDYYFDVQAFPEYTELRALLDSLKDDAGQQMESRESDFVFDPALAERVLARHAEAVMWAKSIPE